MTHHGDDVRGVADLAELVRDEEHRLALAAERGEDAEELVGVLGSQDRRRLVEDEQVGASVEGLEDLDALAMADAEIGDARVGVDLQVVLAAEPHELGARPAHPGAEPEAAFDAEHHVLEHRECMKCWCTMPIPAASESCELRMTVGSPRTRISPRSGW